MMTDRETTYGRLRIVLLTAAALCAFAANSILCRLALGAASIDAASFTTIRLSSGALALWLIYALRRKKATRLQGSWTSAALLFLYAAAFSFAYIELTAGSGALMLFGAVQATMILAGLLAGERPPPLGWVGLVIALGGLVYLVSPGLAAPPLASASLMASAGLAWGLYSLRGRGVADATAATTGNFIRSVPFVLIISPLMLLSIKLSPAGIGLAVLSGALTSGVGYVIWYAALPGLTRARAATAQLSVPILAAFGGVAFLAEDLSLRLIIAAVLVIGGIGLALRGPQSTRPRTQSPPRAFTAGQPASAGQTSPEIPQSKRRD